MSCVTHEGVIAQCSWSITLLNNCSSVVSNRTSVRVIGASSSSLHIKLGRALAQHAFLWACLFPQTSLSWPSPPARPQMARPKRCKAPCLVPLPNQAWLAWVWCLFAQAGCQCSQLPPNRLVGMVFGCLDTLPCTSSHPYITNKAIDK